MYLYHSFSHPGEKAYVEEVEYTCFNNNFYFLNQERKFFIAITLINLIELLFL